MDFSQVQTLAALAAAGTVTAADVPVILRTRRVWAGLVSALARNPDQVEAAIALPPRLPSHEVEYGVRDWDCDRYTRTDGAEPAPSVPQAAFDAVLEARLTPLAAYLLHPVSEEGWEAVSTFSEDWSLEVGSHSGWAMPARCPERWAELVANPALGAAVQHLLLDQAEVRALEDARLRAAGADPDEELRAEDAAPALSEDLLLACLTALCLPELAEAPNPQVTARRTLHHIAHRVRTNPRLAGLAADQLQAATDALVTRGRLLNLCEKQADDYEFDERVLRLAEDLALLSAKPRPSRRGLRTARRSGSAGRRLPRTEPDPHSHHREHRPRPRPSGPAPGTPLRAPPGRDPLRACRQPAHPALSFRPQPSALSPQPRPQRAAPRRPWNSPDPDQARVQLRPEPCHRRERVSLYPMLDQLRDPGLRAAATLPSGSGTGPA
ncbi:hypothetical protein [Streptomyces sp. NPDC007369]|uniref:hypothetical protein n=1 Tax=Streptomyces sp. NPDC007369 TaxID=3154589 RepID=UPI0034013373